MEPARLLDLTRLVSRLGRGPLTGIDRVELAYLTEFLRRDGVFFGLVHSAVGWLLLDQTGCAALARHILSDAPLPKADLLSRLTNRHNPLRAQAETLARRLAVARAARPLLARLLRRVPKGASYFNTGHANLSPRSLGAVRRAGLSSTVLIHDTIPLDHPEFARPDTIAAFQRKLAATATHADRVLHLTHAQRQLTEAQLAKLGRVPKGLVAPLGVTVATPDPAALPPGAQPDQPYFVCLGTIEPRKNHALLLEVWERLGPEAPILCIIGGRGWASAALFDRLDRLVLAGRVKVFNGLSDPAVAALVQGAAALLHPSLAEGFGLPPVEAATLGTPVIATDLPVTREVLGDKAVYLDPTDIYSWMETIIRQAQAGTAAIGTDEMYTPPSWDAHFNTVLNHA